MAKEVILDSNIIIQPLYTSADAPSEQALPGTFPFTRGVHSGMYRDKLWTMR